MNMSKALAVGLFLSVSNACSQGTILFRTFLDSTQAVPPNASTRTASGQFELYATPSFTGGIGIREYGGITSVSVFRATSVTDVGTKIFDMVPGGIEMPRPGGGGGGQAFEFDRIIPLTSAEAADLQAGLWWVSVITPEYPNGEIRGQITAVPEPSLYALLAIGSLLLSVRTYRKRCASIS